MKMEFVIGRIEELRRDAFRIGFELEYLMRTLESTFSSEQQDKADLSARVAKNKEACENLETWARGLEDRLREKARESETAGR